MSGIPIIIPWLGSWATAITAQPGRTWRSTKGSTIGAERFAFSSESGVLKIRGAAGAVTTFSRHGSTCLARLGRLVVSAGGPLESPMCFIVRPAISTITGGSWSRFGCFVRTASIPPQTRVQANAPNSPTTSFSP